MELEHIAQKLADLKTLFDSTLTKVDERDKTIVTKDARIAELTDKLVEVSKLKDEALWAKIELMKQMTAERENVTAQILQLQKDLGEKTSKVKKLKQKSREAQDGLMGSSFELDRIKKDVDDKEKTILEYEEKVASVASGSTGILYDINSSIEYMLERIKEANRSLRIVAPSIEFLVENGLIGPLNALPESCVVNIAVALDLTENQAIIDQWKARGWHVFNFSDKNFLMIAANGADVSIAYIAGQKVSGFFSNIADLVTIFKQALMHPYIKAVRI